MDVGAVWLRSVELSTSADNYRPLESRWRVWVLPIIGTKKVDRLTDQDLQDVLNLAHAAGKSRKTFEIHCSRHAGILEVLPQKQDFSLCARGVNDSAGGTVQGQRTCCSPMNWRYCSAQTPPHLTASACPTPISTPIGSRSSPACARANCWACAGEDVHGGVVYISRSINVDGEETQGKNQNAVRSFALSARARACWRINGGSPAAPAACSASAQSLLPGPGRPIATNGILPLRPTNLRHTFVSVTKTLPEGE